MSKNKTDLDTMYIYVDINDGMWFAGNIQEDKQRAVEDWQNSYDAELTPNGFFIEVLVPSIENIVQAKIEDIPVYTI